MKYIAQANIIYVGSEAHRNPERVTHIVQATSILHAEEKLINYYRYFDFPKENIVEEWGKVDLNSIRIFPIIK